MEMCQFGDKMFNPKPSSHKIFVHKKWNKPKKFNKNVIRSTIISIKNEHKAKSYHDVIKPYQEYIQIKYTELKESQPQLTAIHGLMLKCVDGIHKKIRDHIFYYSEKTKNWEFKDTVYTGGKIIIIGSISITIFTTAMLCLIIFIVSLLGYDDEVAESISEYLTDNSGYEISFGGIKGDVKGGKIQFTNVTIKRYVDGLTKIDLTIDRLDIELSIMWEYWYHKGFIKHVHANGVRGTIDRRDLKSVLHYTKNCNLTDWTIENFTLMDCKIDLFNKSPKRNMILEINEFECDNLRNRWFIQDIITAKKINGSFDGALFSLKTIPNEGVIREFRLSGLDIDVINEATSGPLNWLTKGHLDIKAFLIKNMKENNEYNFDLDCDITLNNLNANIPINNGELSYINTAMTYPIIVYLNTNYTKLPLNMKMTVSKKELENAWYPADFGLWDKISEGVYYDISARIAKETRPEGIKSMIWNGFDGIKRGLNHCYNYMTFYWWYSNVHSPK